MKNKTAKQYLKDLIRSVSKCPPVMGGPQRFNLTHKSQKLLAEIDTWLFEEYQEEYNEEGLLYCPFCGSEACLMDCGGGENFYVACSECCDLGYYYDNDEGHSGEFKTEQEAIGAWNRRV